MRLWSLHPRHLDARGLVALWREALLAQAVLAGMEKSKKDFSSSGNSVSTPKTKGYTKHPQLERFKSQKAPLRAIGAYLSEVQKEGERRGYKFDRKKIMFPRKIATKMPVTEGQLKHEWLHLKKKLLLRNRKKARENARARKSAHPIFRKRKGKAESWEKTK